VGFHWNFRCFFRELPKFMSDSGADVPW
jgi:hypothetical protein